MKNPHDIILRPVLTEKSYDGMADKRYNKCIVAICP